MIKSLYDNFKHWSDNGCVWIISDPHFGDEDCKLMNQNWPEPGQQVRLINKTIGKQDTLICLGDVGDENYIKQIKCQHKVLITGNHDKGVNNYKRVTDCEKVAMLKYLNGKTPNDLAVELSEEEQDAYYDGAWNRAFEEYKNKLNFVSLGHFINHEFHSPFMFWVACYDNKLFDEIYDGPLFIADRILLSHEPIFGLEDFCVNIHGHCHNGQHRYEGHINLAADVVHYQPFNLGKAIKDGILSGVPNYHRNTIDLATEHPIKKHT